MKPSTANAGAVQSTPSEHAVVALETLGAKIKRNSEGEAVAVDLSDKQQVTDADLVHLKGLTNLEELGLFDTQITDAGVEHLAGLTNLTSLNLLQTKITDAGIAELQKALPKCRISK